jgi:ribosomal protein S18 acetylase RimI-like enzyme
MIEILPLTPLSIPTFFDLAKQIDAETNFMLLESGERDDSEVQRKRLESDLINQKTGALFLAFHDGAPVGYALIKSGNAAKNRHKASVVIGVLKAYHHNGIGTRLMEELEVYARENAIVRLELSVMVQNTAAIALYKKRGFSIDGTMPYSLKNPDGFVSEYLMSKVLGDFR